MCVCACMRWMYVLLHVYSLCEEIVGATFFCITV